MPRRTTTQTVAADAEDAYWPRRVRSREFVRGLTDLVTGEVHAMANEPVRHVIDAARVRKAIHDWDASRLDRDALADLLIEFNRSMHNRASKQHESVFGLLDPTVADDLDALLDEEFEFPEHSEDFVAHLMEQEFVRRLLTDLVLTAITAFNKKVNPFFASMASRVLEDQIKSFVRLFMPMLQKQATTFAVSQTNQRVVMDFTRAVIRELLDTPVSHYAELTSPAQRRHAEDLLKKAVQSPKLDKMLRDGALAAWDEFYKRNQHRKVKELVDLERHAGWIAARVVETVQTALDRAPIARFVADEMARAAREQGQ